MATNGYKIKNIFVTGASGFIGKRLIKILLDNDYRVIVLENKTKIIKRHKNLKIIKADLKDFRLDIYKNIDVVIHLAAYLGNLKDKDESSYIKVNYDYTIRLFEMCKKNNIKFLYCSSAVVLEDQAKLDWYAKSKLMATEYIRKDVYKKWLIIYPSLVIDVKETIKGIISGFFMARIGRSDRFINIVSVDNVVLAIVKMIEKGNLIGEYVLGGINIMVGQYLRRSYQLANKFYLPLRLPQVLVKGLCFIVFGRNNLFNILSKKFLDQRLDSKKAKENFSYEIENGLELYLDK